jgi:hypothetical protein
MSQSTVTLDASSGGTIAIEGFVHTPGRYACKKGMTLEDALDMAGGYAECESCQRWFEASRRHATYDQPPKIKRAGRRLELPKARAEWMRFILEPGDEIEFRHFII